MTSREIAELTGKEHKHVRRDIKVMLNQLGLSESNFARNYTDSLNRQQTEYALNKDLTLTLVSGYNTGLRFKIIQRWQELEEASKAPALPTTYLEALEALITTEKQKIAIQQKLEEAAPKIHHYDSVVKRDTLLTATQVGQKINLTAHKLNKKLEELGVYNRAIKRGRAFNNWFVSEGLGVMKQANKGYSQPLITTKGENWIVEKLTYQTEEQKQAKQLRQEQTDSVINDIDNLLSGEAVNFPISIELDITKFLEN